MHQRPRKFPEVWADRFDQVIGNLSDKFATEAIFTDGLTELFAAFRRRIRPIFPELFPTL